MVGKKELIMQKICIFYNDTYNSVSKIYGEFIKESSEFFELKTDRGAVKIPKSKIVRIEIDSKIDGEIYGEGNNA